MRTDDIETRCPFEVACRLVLASRDDRISHDSRLFAGMFRNSIARDYHDPSHTDAMLLARGIDMQLVHMMIRLACYNMDPLDYHTRGLGHMCIMEMSPPDCSLLVTSELFSLRKSEFHGVPILNLTMLNRVGEITRATRPNLRKCVISNEEIKINHDTNIMLCNPISFGRTP
ncbi:uncharacterized protein LOC127118703 isoform X2 [Lathyrus oleraceus]|uniref:uncharacterized protein LOC127118703 isoform X2 n=1 Tax=Pisum sativum TaxID=3888 RepID=UPI0021D126B9|nr:uncharacterized protein LOC127118703 isoform X2 [Pisum sativum]